MIRMGRWSGDRASSATPLYLFGKVAWAIVMSGEVGK